MVNIDQHQLLATKITNQLREQVLSLRTHEMVRFTPERILAESLGVSRQTLRSAIRVLIEEGLLVQKKGSGTYIVPDIKLNDIHMIMARDLKVDDPFYMAFLSEISNHLSVHSINLVIINENNIPENIHSTPVIIVGYLRDNIFSKVNLNYKNKIAVQSHPKYKDIVQIDFDYYKIGYDAVLEFVKANHDTVLHIAGPDEYPASIARRRGFQDAVRDTGINGYTIIGKMNWNYGDQQSDHIYKTYVQGKKTTGIFAANDWMALGLIHHLKDLGVGIPNDVSILGCDDIPLSSQVIPKLSTFRGNFSLLISSVYEVINDMFYNNFTGSKQILIPAAFIKRESMRLR